MAKESDLTKIILNYLIEKGHYAFKHWGGMMGTRGVSDIIGVKRPEGTAFFLEVKKPGLEAEDKQKNFLFDCAMAGAITGVIHTLEEVKKLGL